MLIDEAIEEMTPLLGSKRAACRAAGRPQANHYRRHRQSPPPVVAAKAQPRPQPRALSPAEREHVREVLNSERFVDAAPASVYYTLLDEGTYLCSPATMYRILRENGEVRERRRQATHPAKVKPELLATGPNRVWSWDITKLRGPAKWTYYYLYVIIDVYSRYTVGWLLAARESSVLAEELLADSIAKQGVGSGQLTVHADRGSSMASKTVAQLLADLGVTKTHSRPRVSNDNPFSESQFKTLKYRPDFPGRFNDIAEARAHAKAFFWWYNHEHRHSGIGFHIPRDVHYGHAGQVRDERAAVLAAAYISHPERFVRTHPEPPTIPERVWINKPEEDHSPSQGTGRSPRSGSP